MILTYEKSLPLIFQFTRVNIIQNVDLLLFIHQKSIQHCPLSQVTKNWLNWKVSIRFAEKFMPHPKPIHFLNILTVIVVINQNFDPSLVMYQKSVLIFSMPYLTWVLLQRARFREYPLFLKIFVGNLLLTIYGDD